MLSYKSSIILHQFSSSVFFILLLLFLIKNHKVYIACVKLNESDEFVNRSNCLRVPYLPWYPLHTYLHIYLYLQRVQTFCLICPIRTLLEFELRRLDYFARRLLLSCIFRVFRLKLKGRTSSVYCNPHL